MAAGYTLTEAPYIDHAGAWVRITDEAEHLYAVINAPSYTNEIPSYTAFVVL